MIPPPAELEEEEDDVLPDEDELLINPVDADEADDDVDDVAVEPPAEHADTATQKNRTRRFNMPTALMSARTGYNVSAPESV